MRHNPLISIVIPMYNSEKYIEQCLNSLVHQTDDNFEVIVVDDGSTDRSLIIAKKYSDEYDFISVIHQSNTGVIATRRVGSAAARGKYILNVDSDDYLLPNHIEEFTKEINRNHPDIVVSGYTEFFNNQFFQRFQNIEPGYYTREEIEEVILPNLLSYPPFFNFGIFPTLWTTCVKKGLIIQCQEKLLGTYSIGDDISVTYPAILLASGVSILNICSYIYRIRESSMTHVFDEKLSEKMIYLFSYLQEALPASDAFEKQFTDYVVFEVCILVSNYLGHGLMTQTYKQSVASIFNVLDNSVVKNALTEFRLYSPKVPFKYKTKVFLIKHRLLALYRLLVA